MELPLFGFQMVNEQKPKKKQTAPQRPSGYFRGGRRGVSLPPRFPNRQIGEPERYGEPQQWVGRGIGRPQRSGQSQRPMQPGLRNPAYMTRYNNILASFFLLCFIFLETYVHWVQYTGVSVLVLVPLLRPSFVIHLTYSFNPYNLVSGVSLSVSLRKPRPSKIKILKSKTFSQLASQLHLQVLYQYRYQDP